MERRKLLTGGLGSAGAIVFAATYQKADRVPVLEERLAAYERRLAILENRGDYFHGERTRDELVIAAEKANGAR